MELSEKVRNALSRFVDGRMSQSIVNDDHHMIDISEPEFGHIIIDIKEHKTEVNK